MRVLGSAWRQCVAVFCVGWWQINIERREWLRTRLNYCVFVAALNEHQSARFERILVAVHDRLASATLDIELLIGAVMAIASAALGAARLDHHRGRLRARVAGQNVEPLEVAVARGRACR